MSKLDSSVKVTLGLASQVYDTNWNGEIIKDSEEVLAQLNSTIDIDSERRVAFSIVASLHKQKLRMPDEKHIGDRIGFLTRKAISNYLSDCCSIELFQIHRISLMDYLGNRLPQTPRNPSEFLAPFRCTITTEVFNFLSSQYIEYSTARESFNHAVKELRSLADLSPAGLKHHKSEVYSLLDFIGESLASAEVGHMGGWYKEKQSGICSSFEDMFRRKQANHPGYKSSQDYITRTLFSYRAPEVWRDHPPRLNAIDD